MEKILSILLFMFVFCSSGLLAQEGQDPGKTTSEPAVESETSQNEQPDLDDISDEIDKFSNTSDFFDQTYTDPLETDHRFGFYAQEEAGLFSFPQPDNNFTWGLDFFLRMGFVLVSEDMSLTAEPYYSFSTGDIPGTPDQNAFSLYRLYGSLFFLNDIALQIGFLNAEQGITYSKFNPFAWNKKIELFRSTQDQEPWLGISFKSPLIRAFYVYNPDLSQSAGSLSANFYPDDLFSTGLIVERLSSGTNRAGGYIVSLLQGNFTLEADYSAACYFNDSLSNVAFEMDGSASFSFEDLNAQTGLYWNGRRDALDIDSTITDPYGYLDGSLYLYGNIKYTQDQFTLDLAVISNLDDGSILATPSFTFRAHLLDDVNVKVQAEFPLVFGKPGSELYDLIPTSYCAILKLEALLKMD